LLSLDVPLLGAGTWVVSLKIDCVGPVSGCGAHWQGRGAYYLKSAPLNNLFILFTPMRKVNFLRPLIIE
jgi:hypothetical protein